MRNVLRRFIGKKDGLNIYKIVEEIIEPLAKKGNHVRSNNRIVTTLQAEDSAGNIVKTWIRGSSKEVPSVATKNCAATSPTTAYWDTFEGSVLKSKRDFSNRRFVKEDLLQNERVTRQVDLNRDGNRVLRTFLTKETNPDNYATYHTSWDKKFGQCCQSYGRDLGKYWDTPAHWNKSAKQPIYSSMRGFLSIS